LEDISGNNNSKDRTKPKGIRDRKTKQREVEAPFEMWHMDKDLLEVDELDSELAGDGEQYFVNEADEVD
jgi:hypothetical protein